MVREVSADAAWLFRVRTPEKGGHQSATHIPQPLAHIDRWQDAAYLEAARGPYKGRYLPFPSYSGTWNSEQSRPGQNHCVGPRCCVRATYSPAWYRDESAFA